MTAAATVGPDERALREHLRSARFQAGVDGGRWRLMSLTWPFAVITVTAAPRDRAPGEYALRFDLTGYPHRITAAPWDANADGLLPPERRPTGERVGHVFRTDWNEGRVLYAPWDQTALEGHGDWPSRYPKYAWNPQRDLTFYLANVFEVLNNDDYLGLRAS